MPDTSKCLKDTFMSRLPLLLLAASWMTTAPAAVPDLTTVSERSGFLKTGRYDEVIQLCNAFSKVYPKGLRGDRTERSNNQW